MNATVHGEEARAYAESASFTLQNAEAPALLIALHGLGGDRTQPLSTFGALGDEIAVLAPDLRAHGATSATIAAPLLTFDQLADDVTALVHALGQADKPVYLAGISMGAAVALTLLRRASLDVHGVSLVRPAFSAEPVPKHLALFPVVAGLLRLHDPEDGATELKRLEAYQRLERRSPAAAASMLAQFRGHAARDRRVRLTAIPSQQAYSTLRELHTIDRPTQVIGAIGDPVHPLPLAEEWAEAIPDASLVTVPSRDQHPEQHADLIRSSVASHAITCFD